jgi:hypothetical protein
MLCTRCNGPSVDDQFYDRVDEQGQLTLGAWHWVSRCPTCGMMVYEPVEGQPVGTSVLVERMNTMSMT